MRFLREIARFLHFYPGYTKKTLLKERADFFFSMLNESYKLESRDKLQWIGIVSTPHMERSSRDSVINSYKRASDDIINLDDLDDYSAIQKLKKLL